MPDAQDAREQAYREHVEQTNADGSGLVFTGVAASVLLPPVGIAVGIVLLFKERVGPGLGCIFLSLLVMAVALYSVLAG